MKVGRAAAVIAALFLLLHLPHLPPSLEDLDSVNFALGLRDYDVAQHQPHPPGYPLFMLVAKAVMGLTGSEVHALSLTSLLSGTAAVFPLMILFTVLSRDRRGAVLAAVALVCATPLFWLTAVRPLSDTAGLAGVLAVDALLVRARTPRQLAWAAGAAGLAIGLRSQVAWLTLPLVAVVTLTMATPRRGRLILSVLAASAAGGLVWAGPLVFLSGGLREYWRVLTAQGAEDFGGVSMLLTSFSPRLALDALHDTFIAPWVNGLLAVPVLVAAASGAVMALLTDRRAVLLLAASFGPYLAFHLLLQETFTTRYALPLLIPIAWFAVRGLEPLGRVGLAAAGGLAVASLWVAHPAVMAYGRAEAPGFRLLADMQATSSVAKNPPVLGMHRRGAFDFRRPLRWVGAAMPPLAGRLESPPKREWLEVVRYWNRGGRSPVWFVADPDRTDLALIHQDGPTSSYRWPFPSALVGGARPDTIDWYVFDQPAWYLGEGWSLTPETAGVAAESGQGPRMAPIEAWIRRPAGPLRLMIGGRNLDPAGPPVQVEVRLEDRLIDAWTVVPGFFLRWIDVDDVEGADDYARLTVAATHPALAIEQFDAQPVGTPMYGFAGGWHELEFNPVQARLWRWMSDRAVIEVRNGSGDLLLHVDGETGRSAVSPRLRVLLGEQVLLEQQVDGTFSFAIPIPGSGMSAGAATIALETDQIHVPAERDRRSTDRRRLGLRIFSASIRPAS